MIWIVLIVALAFGAGALLGAPYLPILGRDVDQLLDLADLKPGQHLIDLGSGDGKLLKAAAKRGIYATGYEINPILFIISQINCWPWRSHIKIHLSDFWQIKWPPAEAIYVFLIGRYMVRLDAKAQVDITTPTKLVSYVFEIPNRVPVRSTKNSYVYLYPIRK